MSIGTMSRLTASDIAALDPYAFFAVLGKRVIHPGARGAGTGARVPAGRASARDRVFVAPAAPARGAPDLLRRGVPGHAVRHAGRLGATLPAGRLEQRPGHLGAARDDDARGVSARRG